MSVLHLFSKKRPSPKGFQPKSTSRKVQKESFILEPILTPSGLVDGMDDTPDLAGVELSSDPLEQVSIPEIDDISPDSILDNSIPDEELEEIPFITEEASELEEPLNLVTLENSNPTFESGVFTVGDSGEVQIEFLFDGGGYRGELAIFSLEGMDQFEPGSEDFILEASRRALSDSELGHIVIADQTEGARFSGLLGEGDQNAGEYLGAKSFVMRPGDKFGFMLVPNGQVQQVFDNPEIGGAVHPLFSLATANPDDGFHLGQIADVTGDGNTFVMEDWRVDTGSDLDYNDFIFRVGGAEGEAASLDDVIDLDHDWRNTALGKELLDYAASFLEPDDPIIVLAPEGQTQIDLELLFPHLPEEESWVFEVVDQGTQNLDPQIEGEDALIVQTQPDADIDRIAVQVTNDQGDRYVQHPILVAKGPDSATRNVVTKLLDGFGEVFEALSDRTSLEGNQELSALVASLDSLIEEQPNTLKFLIKPELLEALNFDQSQVGTAYRVIHSESVGQLLGLPVSLHEALTGSDPGAWERLLIEAHDLPDLPDEEASSPFISFIDFAERGHDEKTLEVFNSIEGIEDQDYSLVHTNDGNWADQLTRLVDQAKSSGQPGAVIHLGFDLTQLDDLQQVTTRYELTSTEQQALQYAQDNNVLLVVAAGNTGDKMSALGTASKIFNNILVVGSVTRWEEKADYSSQGEGLSLVAPGGQWENDPEAFVGTSKSTAYVTAVASLVWKANPDLNYQQVKDILLKTADDLAEPGWDSATGAGLLDAAEAILLAQQTQEETLSEAAPIQIEAFSGEGRVETLARPASDPQVPGANLLEASPTTQTDFWNELLGTDDSPDPSLGKHTFEVLGQYQQLKAEVSILSAQERLLEEGLALVEQQAQVESNRYLTLQNEYQTLAQDLQALSFEKFILENQVAIYKAFTNGEGNSLKQKLQNAGINLSEGSRGEILAARIIELESAIASEQLWLNKNDPSSSLRSGVEAERDAYTYELQAVQDLLMIDGLQKQQEIKRINQKLAQKQDRITDIEEDFVNSQENLTQLDLQLESVPNELEAVRLAQEKGQENLRSLLEMTGFSLPYRERMDAIQGQVEYLKKRLGEVANEDESTQNAVSKDLEWAKTHLNILTASAPLTTLEGELNRLITDLSDYHNSVSSGDLPTQEYIDYLEEIRRNQQAFLNTKETIAQKKDFAEITYTLAQKALEKLWDEHIQLTLNKSQIEDVLSYPNLEISYPVQYQAYKQALSTTENLLSEKYQAIQLTERYVEQVKDFAGKLQNLDTFFTQVDKETELHQQRNEQWKVSNQNQSGIYQGILEGFNKTENLEAMLLELGYLSSQSELLKTTDKLDIQQSLLEQLLTQDELLKEEQLYYYNLSLQHEANTWAAGFYSASEAAAVLENHQQASLIADQRNKLWVQIQAALSLVKDTEAQKAEQEAVVGQTKQQLLDSDQKIPEYDTVAELQNKLALVLAELDPFLSQLESQVSALESNIANSKNKWESLQEAMHLRTEVARKLIAFGLVASESDPDFFYTQIEPKVEAFISELQQHYQLLNDSKEELSQVIGTLGSSTLSEAIGDSTFVEDYLKELEAWQSDTAATVGELRDLLNDTWDSLAIVRQQQNLDEQLKAPRPELVTAKAAEAALSNESIQGYAQLHDQVADDLVGAVKTWTKDLQASHQITQDLIAAQSTQSQAVDELIKVMQAQLADPYGQYRIAKSHLRDQITTQEAIGDRGSGFAKALSDTRNRIEYLKLKLDQDKQLWESLDEIAARNGLESPAMVDFKETYKQIPTRLYLESLAARYDLLSQHYRYNPLEQNLYHQYQTLAFSFRQQASAYPPIDSEKSVSILKGLIEQAQVINPDYVNEVSAATDYLDKLEKGLSQLPSMLDSFEIIDSLKPSKLLLQEITDNHSKTTDNRRGRYSQKLKEATRERKTREQQLDPNNPTSLYSLLYGYGKKPVKIFGLIYPVFYTWEVKGVLTKMDEALDESRTWRKNNKIPLEENLRPEDRHPHWILTKKKKFLGIEISESKENLTDYALLDWLRFRDEKIRLENEINRTQSDLHYWKGKESEYAKLEKQWIEADNAASQAEWQAKQVRNTIEQLKAKTDYETPELQADLVQAQNLLLTLDQQALEAQQEAQAIKTLLEQAWETYMVESHSYQEATVDVLKSQSEIERKALQYRSILAEIERWIEGQTIATNEELQQAVAIKVDLEAAIQTVQAQITDAAPTELTELATKEAQLRESLALLLSKINILEARQTALTQKRALVAASDAVIVAEEKLLQAYLVNPDQDTSTLEAELSAAREALAEAQRLAEQAEASSKALTAPLKDLQEELLARNDEHIQQARQQQQILKELREATQLNLNYTLKATEAQQKVNGIESQIIAQLQQAVDAGNQEAISLLKVAETNDRATLAELYYKDYGDLASDKKFAKPEYRQLADQYYQEWQHLLQVKEQEKQQAEHWKQLRQKAEEQLEVLKDEEATAQEELDKWNAKIAETQEEIEAKEQALAIAGVRLESIEQIRAETERTFIQLASLEQLNLAQAQLEVQIAEKRDADIEQSIQDRLAREQQVIDRKRKVVLAQIEQLKQIQSEADLQQTLNEIRGDLGMTDLDIVESPVQLQTQMAELLGKLDGLETEQPDLPDDLKALLTEVKGDIHLALQGEEAASIQANLLAVADGMVEQIEQYKAELAQIDLESQQEAQLLQLAQSDLQEASKQFVEAVEKNQELRDQLDDLNIHYWVVLQGIAYAEQQVEISEQWAAQAREALDQIIAQRKEARKQRKKAFWNKLLSGISTVVGVLGAITSFIPGLNVIGLALVGVSAGINAIQSAVNGDWAGAVFGAVMGALNVVTAGASSGLLAISQAGIRAIQGVQAAASGLFNGIRSIKSGNGIMGALQILGGAAGTAAVGLGNALNKASEVTRKVVTPVLNSLKQAPQLIYKGVQAIKDGDWIGALDNLLNSAVNLGENISSSLNSSASKILDSVLEGAQKAGGTVVNLASAIKEGGIKAWFSSIYKIGDIWKDELQEIAKPLLDRIFSDNEQEDPDTDNSDNSQDDNQKENIKLTDDALDEIDQWLEELEKGGELEEEDAELTQESIDDLEQGLTDLDKGSGDQTEETSDVDSDNGDESSPGQNDLGDINVPEILPTEGQEYGSKFKSDIPPGLPKDSRMTSPRESALPYVESVAEQQGLGDDFTKTVEHLAKTESGGQFARPANNFDARPKLQRPEGKGLITAWGTFQFNRDAWRSLPGVGEEDFPWDSTPYEEISRPIQKYGELYSTVTANGGSSIDAARGIRLWHMRPNEYRNYVNTGKTKGFSEAWGNVNSERNAKIDRHLRNAGVL